MEEMNENAAYAEQNTTRRGLYLFFAGVFQTEASEETLRNLAELDPFQKTGNERFDRGAELFAHSLRNLGFNAVTDLAVDYARVILGAGISTGEAAYPYESVYTSEEGLMMQDSRDSVLSWYRRHGFVMSEEAIEPEDHISFELQFMANLVQMEMEAETETERKAALSDELSFLEEHLAEWAPGFCSDVRDYARTEYYRGLASLLEGFLEIEVAALRPLLEEGGEDERA